MKPEVFAVYFPNFHPSPFNEQHFGKGWSEWDLVRDAPPRFPGHHQPMRPSWGYFDEADPVWSAREIDLAADHGISGFLVDWYWSGGTQLLHEQLENGFLRAPNRDRLKFALMWANCPWMDFFPVDEGKAAAEMPCLLPIIHSEQDMKEVAAYCVEHYFRHPNYWRVGGRLYFSFFTYAALEKAFGTPAGIAGALDVFDSEVRKSGLPGMHFNLNIANVDVSTLCWNFDLIGTARQAGFHSVFGYNVARSSRHHEIPLTRPLVDYEEIMDAHRYLWANCANKELPFFPTVTIGYDCSPRWSPEARFPLRTLDYPYEPIIINNSPEHLETLCRDAARVAEEIHSPVVFVNAWNEWTEGNVLLPEERTGTTYLEAVRRGFQP